MTMRTMFLSIFVLLVPVSATQAREWPILDRILGRPYLVQEYHVITYPVVPVLVTSSPTVIYSQPAIPMVPHNPTTLAPLPVIPSFGERR